MPYIPEDQKRRSVSTPMPYNPDENKVFSSHDDNKVLPSRAGQLKRCGYCRKGYYGESPHTCPTCNRNYGFSQGDASGDYERD